VLLLTVDGSQDWTGNTKPGTGNCWIKFRTYKWVTQQTMRKDSIVRYQKKKITRMI